MPVGHGEVAAIELVIKKKTYRWKVLVQICITYIFRMYLAALVDHQEPYIVRLLKAIL